MGTTVYPRCMYKNIKERHEAFIRETEQNDKWVFLASTLKGNYGIYAVLKPDSGRKFICINKYSMFDGEVGEKGFDESCGVYFYDVPLKYLKLTEDTTHERGEIAIEWRNKVKEHHSLKKKLKDLILVTGQIYNLYGKEFRFATDNLFYGEDGKLYRLKGAQVMELKQNYLAQS